MIHLERDEPRPETLAEEGERFVTGCLLVGLPLSLSLWCAIFAVAGAVI